MTTTIERSQTDRKVHPELLVPQIENNLTRREFLIWAGGLLVLAPYGCASGGEGANEADSQETRTIEHALGRTKVPSNPQRVVVLSTGLLDAAITLGVTPIAAPQSEGEFPAYLGDATEGIKHLGDPTAEPNLEKIAALEPDLILTEEYGGEVFGGYENFSEIAPTVPITFASSAEWREYVAKSAETLGREEQLAEAKADYEKHAVEVAGKIAPVIEGREVATLRIEPETILAYGPNSFTGTVLADARVLRPEPPAGVKETFDYYEVSPKLLARVDGDIILVYSQEPGAVEELSANPLWDDLPAVRNGLVFEVDFEHWLIGVGYSAASANLDDLENHLLDEPVKGIEGHS
jgi:iron complex transport system substrate-binding protein